MIVLPSAMVVVMDAVSVNVIEMVSPAVRDNVVMNVRSKREFVAVLKRTFARSKMFVLVFLYTVVVTNGLVEPLPAIERLIVIM